MGTQVTYEYPTSLDTALRIAGKAGGKIVAGGTDVYPAAKQGDSPANFLDVTRVAELSGIGSVDGTIRIGAATTWTQIVKAKLPSAFDALKEAALEIGSIQIQNAGTIAGNICNASPAADAVPPLLALNAQVELASAARGRRVVALEDFIQGVRATDLAPDELMTSVIVPPLADSAKSAFEKLGSRRYLVISISMVAAVITCSADGRIADARVSVGSCSPRAKRLGGLELDLVGKLPSEVDVLDHHFAPLSPISDVRGSAAYRLDVVRAQCMRAIQRAAA